MAIITIPEFMMPGNLWYDPNVYTPFLLDASGEALGFIFRAPKAGVINTIGFRLGAVTTGQTLRVSLQDVDLTTGLPDGIIDHSGTVGVANTDDNLWKQVTLSNRTVAFNELVAVVIDYLSTVGNLEISSVQARAGGGRTGFQNSAYLAHFTTSWAKQAHAIPCIAVGYSDGSHELIIGNAPISSLGISTTLTSISSPDEVALRFKYPVDVRIKGVWLSVDPFTAGTLFDLILYDKDNVAQRTASWDGDVTPEDSIIALVAYFPSSFVLAKNTVCRAAVKVTSGGGLQINVYHCLVYSNAVMNAIEGGKELYRSTRTAAGAWTDVDTARPFMGVIIDGVEEGALAAGTGPTISSSNVEEFVVRGKVI